MEAQELASRIKNKQGSYEEVIQWCEEHSDDMDLTDESQKYLYDTAIGFMMKNRISSLTENEAQVMIKYLSKSYLHEKGLDARTKIDVLSSEEFERKYPQTKGTKTNGMCKAKAGVTFELDYSPNVIENLRSGNANRFLDGLKTIYHEAAHVIQRSSISLEEINGEKVHYEASLYEVALENVARVADSKFYNSNYGQLLVENQANKVRFTKRLYGNKKICTPSSKII